MKSILADGAIALRYHEASTMAYQDLREFIRALEKNGELKRIIALPEVQERYASLGMNPAHSSPREVTELIRSDTRKFGPILKAAGVEPE